ncbi:hypothetical protein J4G33_06450 [Actinotalea sp. BY-33]|uniref:Uncharacterized protein n=1 Tax=Actinotalea soli TaxID=2819234 RepID=A0A939LNX1_9CELL|nr:hypothetical protein [Actinotalea soli]MBO1751441.1 hypothetical protein [Actinotalea soli]
MAAGLWVYAIVVGVLMWVGRRERRPKAERDGLTRTPAAEHGHWLLERVEHRVGVDDDALRAVRELIDGLVPPGESVGAAPASNAEEAELRSIGFDQGPGSWGNLLLERSGRPRDVAL